ncbi:MAG: hypothetical protein U0X93_05805 [Anaerolineales bacterium]
MQFVATLLNQLAYVEARGMAGLVRLRGLVRRFPLYNWRNYHRKLNQRAWWIPFTLAVFTPIVTLFIGLEFQNGARCLRRAFPPKRRVRRRCCSRRHDPRGRLARPVSPARRGPQRATARGVHTHSIFSILEFGLRDLRGLHAPKLSHAFFRLLRQLSFSVVMLSLIHALIFIVKRVLHRIRDSHRRRAARHAFSNTGTAILTFGIEMLIAGFAAQILTTVSPHLWGNTSTSSLATFARRMEHRDLLRSSAGRSFRSCSSSCFSEVGSSLVPPRENYCKDRLGRRRADERAECSLAFLQRGKAFRRRSPPTRGWFKPRSRPARLARRTDPLRAIFYAARGLRYRYKLVDRKLPPEQLSITAQEQTDPLVAGIQNQMYAILTGRRWRLGA